MSLNKLPNLNKVLIAGVLTRDPESRFTTSNVPVVNFRIVSSKRYRDGSGIVKDDVCHIGVVAWQKLAESCGKHLRKGDAVMIEGELKSRVRNESNGSRRSFVEIRAQQIQFLNRQGEMMNLDGENENTDEIQGVGIEAEHAGTETMMSRGDSEISSGAYDYDDNTL